MLKIGDIVHERTGFPDWLPGIVTEFIEIGGEFHAKVRWFCQDHTLGGLPYAGDELLLYCKDTDV